MANYRALFNYIDDAGNAIPALVNRGTRAQNARRILDASNIPDGPTLDGINFSFGRRGVSAPTASVDPSDTLEAAARTMGKTTRPVPAGDPSALTVGDARRLNQMYEASGGSESGFGSLPQVPQFTPVSLPTPQARNMGRLNRNAALATGGAALGGTGLAYAGSQGMFDGISLNDIDFGSSAASEPTPSSSPAQSRSIAQTRGTGRTPEGNDKTMFDWMKGDGTPSSGGSSMTSRANSNSRRAANNSPAVNPTPSISPAEAAAVEQAVVEQAAVEQAVAEQAAAQAVAEGTWTPQRGDTLYSKFGGDWDKINAFAELNKIDPDEIYAGRVYQMLANTPSMSVLNKRVR